MATDPILLRPWTDADLPAILDIFTTSDDLTTQYPLPVTSLDEAATCREKMLTWDESRRNFAIEVDGIAVGNIGITGVEQRHHTGWVSYFSSGAARGRGLVTRSAIAATNWALGELGLFRLELGHRMNNPASGAIALAAGFTQEGHERQKLEYDGERFDVLTYGRLATDPAPAAPGVTLWTEPARTSPKHR